MSDLKDLYQEMILDHHKNPRNYKVLSDADHKAEGFNPLCGDECSVTLKLKGDVVEDIGFQGSGCAISKASTSVMTTCVKGKTKGEIEKIFENFHHMVCGTLDPSQVEGMGKLAVFSGVSEFPARVKCASLAWHTLKAALENKNDKVSTE